MDKCSLCDDGLGEWGNNAWPLAEEDCCDKCNHEKVLPARLGADPGALGTFEEFKAAVKKQAEDV
jgi:hypothetical protein